MSGCLSCECAESSHPAVRGAGFSGASRVRTGDQLGRALQLGQGSGGSGEAAWDSAPRRLTARVR